MGIKKANFRFMRSSEDEFIAIKCSRGHIITLATPLSFTFLALMGEIQTRKKESE